MIIKCKMCGGDIEFTPGATYGVCEYCGSTSTIPQADDESKLNRFNRANHFRRQCEFDKAVNAYEKILEQDESDAEAHWGTVISRYGIEYVEDPATGKRIPTCHRVQVASILADADYLAAVENAPDTESKRIYQEEAQRIAEIQKGILAISANEKPYDVFICYKETDENGQRTHDSQWAQDVYYGLTEQGYKVFFSRITLEDKLGQQYEPYIFAALNSAKVMVVIGSKPEYFNAVWVKNEWSRYLALMTNDRKRLLIPCYRGMDPYDLPEELSSLQSQDMSKIGFMQDLLRGIKKVIDKEADKPKVQETAAVQQSASGNGTTSVAQVQRGEMALEDHEWEKANSFFEEALNLDPHCAEAYLGEHLVKWKQPDFASWINTQKVKYSTATTERLEACPVDTDHIKKKTAECAIEGYLEPETISHLYKYNRGYDSVLSCRKNQKAKQQSELAAERLLTRAKQYAKGATQKQIDGGLAEITAELDRRIADAEEEDRQSIARVKAAYEAFLAQADKKAESLNEDAQSRREQRYRSAVSLMKSAGDVPAYEKARDALKAMNGYKDSNDLAAKCQKEIDRLNEEKRQEEERQAAILKKEAERAAKKRNKILAIAASVVAAAAVVCVAVHLLVTKVIIPNNHYNAALALYENGQYEEAITVFQELDGYKDSTAQIEEIKPLYHQQLLDNAEVGSTVYFGTYEQDNNTSNGKEDIEWVVLDKDGANILVISKYALDCQQYNTTNTDVTWEICSLRKWLNGTFLNEAFSTEEAAMIVTTTVTADKNPEYDTDAGNDMQDRVFLLSITEAEKYFSSDEDRMCAPTAYAIAQGAYTSSSNTVGGAATCWCWLRSPGYSSLYAAYVNYFGSVYYVGNYVDFVSGCVRPALWINLES